MTPQWRLFFVRDSVHNTHAMNYIDLHCHILPGLDDGPEDCESSVSLVKALADLGFSELHPTPHQTGIRWAPDAQQRLDAANSLREALAESSVEVRIHRPAGENMWDELFASRQHDKSFPMYEGDKAFLLEFTPNQMPPHIQQRLFELRLATALPVIAHVERFPSLLDAPERIAGKAALLVNLSTLGGMSGWGMRRRARRLLDRGIIHALATDAHRAEDIKTTAAGIEWVRRRFGDDELNRLLVYGPQQILRGEIPE